MKLTTESRRLSSADLKKMIVTWLDTPQIKEDMHQMHYGEPGSHTESQDEIDRECSFFKLPKGSTGAQLRDRIWKLWLDPDQWSRQEKRKLGDDWEDYLTSTSYGPRGEYTVKPEFNCDFAGESDQALVDSLVGDPVRAMDCVFRMFVPKSMLGDSYRLEVVTTPEDDAVVGWLVVVD